MSFTPTGGGAERSFELVRQSLLQGDGLSFADALTAQQMQQAFDDEGVSFGRTITRRTRPPRARRQRTRMSA